jgi:CheY-like chemotaxis protein
MFEKNVLIVGNDGIRGALMRIMREYGYKVLEASNGKRALEVIRGDKELDLVITDQGGMSVLNGLGLIYQLRKPANDMPNNIPVILLCDNLKPAEQSELQQYGNVQLLQKPFLDSTLIGAIKAIVALRRELEVA